MVVYSEEDLLLLSGIQHMAFCERQWALIHIEQQWAENVRTIEGKHLHARTDDPFIRESRKDLRIVRAMPVVSYFLGLRGVADVVEYHHQQEYREDVSCKINNCDGRWIPVPVEYKRGRPKKDDRDAVQLCAQAMAIEEMSNITIEYGFLFYGQTKHREEILFDKALRNHTINLAKKMHEIFKEGRTPKAQKGKRCSQCSLIENCQPKLTLYNRPIDDYLAIMIREEETF